MTVTLYKWTLDRYHQAIEAGIFEDQRVELLKGEIIVVSPEREPHTYFSDRCANRLRDRLRGRAQIREGKPIILPDDSEPQPDIAVVQPLDQVYLDHHPYPENIFLLIEYSNSTLKKDLEVKPKIYAEAGIQEYWVVNLQDLEVIVFRDPTQQGYQTKITLKEGAIAPLAFQDVPMEIQQLFSR
jgi:Uma2 family endonuclease